MASRSKPPSSRRQSQEDAHPSLLVFLIEDEVQHAKAISRCFAQFGGDVRVREHGLGAAQEAIHATWDVLVLDLGLPGASGQDVYRDLMRLGEQRPVIIFTSDSSHETHRELLELGVTSFVRKDVGVRVLLEHVVSEVNRQRATIPGTPDPAIVLVGELLIDVQPGRVWFRGRRWTVQGDSLKLLVCLTRDLRLPVTTDIAGAQVDPKYRSTRKLSRDMSELRTKLPTLVDAYGNEHKWIRRDLAGFTFVPNAPDMKARPSAPSSAAPRPSAPSPSGPERTRSGLRKASDGRVKKAGRKIR